MSLPNLMKADYRRFTPITLEAFNALQDPIVYDAYFFSRPPKGMKRRLLTYVAVKLRYDEDRCKTYEIEVPKLLEPWEFVRMIPSIYHFMCATTHYRKPEVYDKPKKVLLTNTLI